MVIFKDKEYKQMELFNPLGYISKRTYMLYSEAYKPWQLQEQEKFRKDLTGLEELK